LKQARRHGRDRTTTPDPEWRTSGASSRRLELDRQSDQLEELRRELSPEEQNLLALRIDQQLSWEEVATVLPSAGEPPSVAMLRKRFERLKERIARMALPSAPARRTFL